MSDAIIFEVWTRIKRVLNQVAPDTAATLAPPATDEDISTLEEAINQTLPADLRTSLKIHNGQHDPTRLHSFCGEGILLSACEIADCWKMVTEIDQENALFVTDLTPQKAPGSWWKQTCIPFTDANGNMMCCDIDPSLGSRVGEVVCFIHDSEIERGLGKSYIDWLFSLAEQLDAGRFRIDDYGYLWLDTESQTI